MTCTCLGSFFPHPQRRGSGPRHEALPLEFSGAMSASYYVAHAELLGNPRVILPLGGERVSGIPYLESGFMLGR